MENQLKILLFGENYLFRTTIETGAAKKVADVLTTEIRNIEGENQDRKISTDREKITILLLAALNIAKENIELTEKNRICLDQISEKVDGIIRLFDTELQVSR